MFVQIELLCIVSFHVIVAQKNKSVSVC